MIPNKQTETTDNLRQAVSMGLELMQTRFKQIDIRPEDLDEGDDPICMPEPIFEPYVHFSIFNVFTIFTSLPPISWYC